MEKLIYHNSIEIDAPISMVWDVLISTDFINYWFDLPAEFKGLKGDTLTLDSEITWRDEKGEIGVKGTVIAMENEKKLTTSLYEYGWNIDLAPEDMAYTYKLSEKEGRTLLTMEFGDFAKVPGGEKTFKDFKNSPENAELQKIKFLAEWLAKLENEGYSELRVCPLPPKEGMGEHTHDVKTAHVILTGELEIKDGTGTQKYKVGDYVEFPAGTTHEARSLENNGMMIVAIKE